MSGPSTAGLKRKMNKNNLNKNIILSLSALIVLSSIAFAVPNSLTLQGKLTNLAGVSQSGTYNFTFAIYDAATAGNKLWNLADYNITTDANGVYDVILTNVNLSFVDQYYLGITVGTDNESSPRINLTSSPYSFRANTSEALNPNASYFITNISIGGHATIGNGTSNLEISTRAFNFSTVTGNLNINGTITAKSFAGDGGGLTGISTSSNPFNSSTANVYLNDSTSNFGLGLNNPSDRLVVIGNVRISGSLNASSINITGITLLGTNSGKVGINITNPSQTLQVLGTLNITSQNTRGGDLFVAATGFVGIGTSSPNDNLDIIGSARISGSLNASSINATNITSLSYNIGWTNLSNYPSACPAGQFISQVGDTLTCAAPSLSAAGGWTDDGELVRLTTFTDSVSIGSNLTGEKLILNGSFRIDNSTTAVFFVNASAQKVGIGLTNPNDALEVVGNVRVSGSLNASFINASRIFVGNTPVQVSGDFDLRNISNYTQYTKSADFNLGNISNYTQYTKSSDFNLNNITNNTIGRAELDNGSIIRTNNLTTLNTLNNYIRTADFNLGNISNYTQFQRSSDFNLGNISNNTLVKGDNVSLALWNTTSVNLPTINLYPRNQNTSLLLGYSINTSANWSDTLIVIGSAAFYGSLNATFINATEIRQGNNKVQTVESAFNLASNGTLFIRGSDFSLANVSNYTQYTKSSDFNLGNISNNTIGRAELDNGSVIRTGNLTALNTLDNYVRTKDFSLGNISNYTKDSAFNASIALWNSSSTAIFNREFGKNVGIGTTSPGQTLHVVGSANISTSLNTPVINTTLATQNLTISSAAGSVIIRLG